MPKFAHSSWASTKRSSSPAMMLAMGEKQRPQTTYARSNVVRTLKPHCGHPLCPYAGGACGLLLSSDRYKGRYFALCNTFYLMKRRTICARGFCKVDGKVDCKVDCTHKPVCATRRLHLHGLCIQQPALTIAVCARVVLCVCVQCSCPSIQPHEVRAAVTSSVYSPRYCRCWRCFLGGGGLRRPGSPLQHASMSLCGGGWGGF